MKNRQANWYVVFLATVVLLLVQLPSPAFASNQKTLKRPVEITYPSASQTTIAPGRDFYVIGTIDKSLVLPDNAHMEVTLTEKESGKIVRTVYTDIKNNKKGMNVDYPRLTLENCTKEEFRNACMPDLIYDPQNPESFRDTWIKAYYNDNIFTCLIYGGDTASKDVNVYDQNGDLLKSLLGDYKIDVSFSKDKVVLAQATTEITIADYPDKVLARFSPNEHMSRVTYDATMHDWMLLLDPFPGYWNMPMFFPEWKLPYQGSIGWKWRNNDALEYAGGLIHMYLYGTSSSSTSYSVELAKLQLLTDLENPARFVPRYYNIGEPLLPNTGERGYFVNMEDDEYLAFTRVDLVKDAEENNFLDMSTLATVESETDLEKRIRANANETIAICGVCRPIQTGTIVYDLQTGAYSWDSELNMIEYRISIDGDNPVYWTSPVSLTRQYDDGSSTTSEFEFRSNLQLKENYAGSILDIDARLINENGVPITDYIKCCSVYVEESYT